MTIDHPYRRALSPAEAFTVMWEEVDRGWWDSTLVEELVKTIQVKVPIGAESMQNSQLIEYEKVASLGDGTIKSLSQLSIWV